MISLIYQKTNKMQMHNNTIYRIMFCVLILCLAFISGCSDYKVVQKVYRSESKAAIAFYKNNLRTLKSLTPEQEMLGWVIRCPDGFRYTTSKIGGTSNVLKEPTVQKGCKVTANLHTHPKPLQGMTADFFSPEDLKSTKYWRMYLLSQENCHIRQTYKSDKRYGILLGKIKECS